jgi:hypothetical protein
MTEDPFEPDPRDQALLFGVCLLIGFTLTYAALHIFPILQDYFQ